jgi:hypothetical protein
MGRELGRENDEDKKCEDKKRADGSRRKYCLGY